MWNNKNYKDDTYTQLFFYKTKRWNNWVHTKIPNCEVLFCEQRSVTKWEAEQLLKWWNKKLLSEIIDDIKNDIDDILYDNFSNYEE